MEFTRLLDQHNIPWYSSEFGPHYKKDKHIRRGWIGLVCPFCGSSKLWLGFNTEHRYFYCWSHGFCDAYKLFRELFPNDHTPSLLQACGIYRTGGNFTSGTSINIPTEHVTPGIFKPPSLIFPLSASPAHQNYLKTRGLDWQRLSDQYAIGAIMQASDFKFSNRLFIPIHDSGGAPVSWVTRSILHNNSLPYIAASKTAEAAPLKSTLYAANYTSRYDPIIIVEGVFDALAINQARRGSAVATFGKKLSLAQLRLISQHVVRIFAFDNEDEAQKDAKRYCNQLSAYPGTTHNVCLDAPDPATAPQHEIDSLLRFAFG